MKFIHAADLHIESPYKGIHSENRELGQALVRCGIRAYEKLIQTCIDEQVDFLLIAGDSFDSDSGSLSAQYRFFRGLEQLKSNDIQVYVVCGNHDPLNQWAKNFTLPDNVHRFGPDTVEKKEFTNKKGETAAIYGVSFGQKVEDRRLVQQFQRTDSAQFAIGLLHGTLAGREHKNPYCPFTMDELRASKMEYWALGHIHKREVVNESAPVVIYPGNLQGRHFNETGDKGCYLISVDNGRVSSKQFVPLSAVVFTYLSQDIQGVNDTSGLFNLLEKIRMEQLSSGSSCLLRLELTGMSELHELLSQQNELDELIRAFNEENSYSGTFVHLDRIINRTLPIIDLEERKLASDFIGDLIRQFELYENDPEKRNRMVEEIMEELKTAKVGRYVPEISDSEEILELLNRAKWKCISGLLTNPDEQ